MSTNQEIRNSDLWAAVRGLRMSAMTVEELDLLIEEHSGYRATFASRVIVEAARQTRAVYNWRWVEA